MEDGGKQMEERVGQRGSFFKIGRRKGETGSVTWQGSLEVSAPPVIEPTRLKLFPVTAEFCYQLRPCLFPSKVPDWSDSDLIN